MFSVGLNAHQTDKFIEEMDNETVLGHMCPIHHDELVVAHLVQDPEKPLDIWWLEYNTSIGIVFNGSEEVFERISRKINKADVLIYLKEQCPNGHQHEVVARLAGTTIWECQVLTYEEDHNGEIIGQVWDICWVDISPFKNKYLTFSEKEKNKWLLLYEVA